MLEVTGELACTGSQVSCDSRLLCQSLCSGCHRILCAKKWEEWKKLLRMARNRWILHMPMEWMN